MAVQGSRPSDNPDDIGVRTGDVLAGKYRVERVLGRGGMGVVVAAHHLQLDERVALKLLLPRSVGSADSIGRFLQEARAAVKIKSEHVARVTDVGQLDSGMPYIVMEYLEGIDLEHWIQERGAMAVQQAVDFVLQACQALAEAHRLGIVHRDLKPANLFCIEHADGQLAIKVLDFGISKFTPPADAASRPGHEMTQTSAVMGSPSYMSPEQMRSLKGVDARTDIWSLGVILFELLTGRMPFEAKAVTELAIMVASEPAPLLREVCPDAPAALEQVVAKCLAKDRAGRYQTVADLAIALESFGSERARASVERVLGTLRKPVKSAPALPASVELKSTIVAPLKAAAAVQTVGTWGRNGGAKPAGKAFVGIAAALLVAVVVGGVFLLGKPAPLPTPAPAAATSVSAPPTSPPPRAEPPAPTDSSSSPPAPPASGGPPASAAAPHPATPRAPRVNCNPPFYVNAKGSRVYKKECL